MLMMMLCGACNGYVVIVQAQNTPPTVAAAYKLERYRSLVGREHALIRDDSLQIKIQIHNFVDDGIEDRVDFECRSINLSILM